MKPEQLFTLSRAAAVTQDARAVPVRAGLSALGVIALAIASSLVLTLGGCASSAGIASSAKPIAPGSVGLDDSSAPSTPSTPSAAAALPADWWQGFGDSVLTGLVERALADSPSLKGAQARLTRAEVAVGGA